MDGNSLLKAASAGLDLRIRLTICARATSEWTNTWKSASEWYTQIVRNTYGVGKPENSTVGLDPKLPAL